MKKVLIIENSSYVTGAAKSIARFANALGSEFIFYWAVPESLGRDDQRELFGDERVYRFKFIEVSRKARRLLSYFPRLIANTVRLNRLVKKEGIGIVHVNDLYNMVGAALRGINRHVRVIYHVRLLRSSYVGPLYGTFLWFIERTADAIVCCSMTVARDVGERRIPVHVIYDSEVFEPGEMFTPVTRDPLRNVLYLGNILPGKGQDLGLRALSAARSAGLDLKMRFVGRVDGGEVAAAFKSRLDNLIEELDLTDHVEFVGFRSDVSAEFAWADLVLNLSESESFSMVCLEAMKAGVPIIASDCGGPGEIIVHMQSGWLVPINDAQATAKAIVSITDQPDLRRSFIYNGKLQAIDKFGVENNALLLKNLF